VGEDDIISAGVIRCIGFDQASDIAATQWGANTGILSGATTRQWDFAIKASGQASLRFTISSNSPADSSGSFWANFSSDLSG
jgi:hypothetical protein